jgi:mRNA interferase MazF
MADGRKLTRGDVWLTALDPTVGSEMRKTRPCVVVSPAELHDYLRTVMIVPLTTGNRPAPYRVETRFQGTAGRITTDHVRTVDKSRLIKRLGELDAQSLSDTLAALRNMFED